MDEFSKESIIIMRKEVSDVKFMAMEICILENIMKIRNMVKELSFGSTTAKEMLPNSNI